MAQSETKKRLLLSKWKLEREELLELRDKQDEREPKIEGLEWQVFELTETLTTVRYWLHDGIVMHRLVSDPRQLLRKVEDALS